MKDKPLKRIRLLDDGPSFLWTRMPKEIHHHQFILSQNGGGGKGGHESLSFFHWRKGIVKAPSPGTARAAIDFATRKILFSGEPKVTFPAPGEGGFGWNRKAKFIWTIIFLLESTRKCSKVTSKVA